MKHRPTPFEWMAFAAVFAMLLLAVVKANSEPHPFIRFEKNFNWLLDDLSWQKMNEQERLRLTRAIWNGAGRDYEIARYAACIGVMETHYTRRERGKRYEKTAGYLGCHNGTLLVERRRLHLRGGSSAWWLRAWKLDPISATWLSASRWAYISSIYGPKIGLKQWVTGEGWKKNAKDRKRAYLYARDVQYLSNKYFGGK